ncbi:RES domain-containing protein (plasmid) [Sphingosinicella sp. BN140058]|nr:RES domain-containing protein [Sphingosinicella sp. BN140058]
MHAAGKGALFYGLRNQTWRWDAPDGSFGLLYLGETPIASFAETLLRWPATKRDVLWSDVDKRRLAFFETSRDLNLAQLHGSGVAAFGVQPEALAGTSYDECQAITAIVHDKSNLDGIRYRSRFNNDEFCIALFERAGAAVNLVTEGEPIDRDWAFDVLKDGGYNLIDL